MSEMYLGTGPSQKGADLSQDVGAASQAGIGPTPTQHEYSTARERRPQADSIPDEHMDEDNGEQWLTQPSQTDAESSRHIAVMALGFMRCHQRCARKGKHGTLSQLAKLALAA